MGDSTKPTLDEILGRANGDVADVALQAVFERAKAQLAANIGQYQRSTQIAALETAAAGAAAAALAQTRGCGAPFVLLGLAALVFAVAAILALVSVSLGKVHYPGPDADFWTDEHPAVASKAEARVAVVRCVHAQIAHNLGVSARRAAFMVWSIWCAAAAALLAVLGAAASATAPLGW